MTELTFVRTPAGVAPGNGYSHVGWGTGRFVAVSGQIAVDENGELVGQDDGLAQSRQAFANMRRCLAEAGATFADVIKLTYYVADLDILPSIRVARDECVDPDRPPASTLVQVASLVRPDLLLEVDAFAIVAWGDSK